jgi:hypothetical protein
MVLTYFLNDFEMVPVAPIIIIIIIIIINCNWVFNQWQWLIYVTIATKFTSGGPHEKHVVATWNLGNHLSICFWTQGNQQCFRPF